jgi:hypothetical protein
VNGRTQSVSDGYLLGMCLLASCLSGWYSIYTPSAYYGYGVLLYARQALQLPIVTPLLSNLV